MPSDRARVSYDPTRQYRGVIAQQGRVTLEADWNEAQVIAGEELCQETLDIVGPSGTPDDGYRVLEGALPRHHFDFRVQQGTMYVGGERVSLSAPLRYGQQEEWLNHAGDPVWVTPRAVGRRKNRREFIYLFLREQEVSAVEDQALKDVALGGPDTDQRARLIQRVVRVATRARDCQGALVEAEKRWATQGLSFSPTTMQLSSGSTLKASFTQPVTEPSLCEPEASGGYLGAENQLIRVQISGLAEDGRPRLLWAYDNASFLYRVVVDPPGGQTLRLLQRPVDDYHMPRAGQAVEVLRSSVRLDGEDYVAAATGAVFTLTTAYDPTTQTVQLPGSLLDDYRDKSKTPQLFLRVWEREETVGTDGSLELTSDLGSTGLKVTLQADDGYHVGDYWEIAVRPSTPDDVYPRRYLEDFQPPDGPRQWACPLAVIEWDDDRLRVVEDCRNPFDNLVELARRRTGCCDVTVRPEDLHGGRTLQSIIDGVPEGERATICLMSGTYELPAPLRLGPEHSHLTIEACHDGAVLRAAPGQEHKFSQGLVLLNRANEVTLRGLRFRLPEPPTRARRVGIRPPFSLPGTWLTSIGVLAFHCAELTVENCLFRYSITREASLISAGILAMSECWRHTIRGNRFLREEFDIAAARGGPYRILVGYLLASSLQLPSKNGRTDNEAASEGTVVPALLEDVTFRDNQFTNLAFPVLVLADAGAVTIEDNTVRGCYAGFLLFSPGTSYVIPFPGIYFLV